MMSLMVHLTMTQHTCERKLKQGFKTFCFGISSRQSHSLCIEDPQRPCDQSAHDRHFSCTPATRFLEYFVFLFEMSCRVNIKKHDQLTFCHMNLQCWICDNHFQALISTSANRKRNSCTGLHSNDWTFGLRHPLANTPSTKELRNTATHQTS